MIDYTKAPCTKSDPEIFFDEAARFAKRICRGYTDGTKKNPPCPVRAACLAESLERGDEYGVFGGLDAKERKALRKASA